MKKFFLPALALLLIFGCNRSIEKEKPPGYVLVIHGGAGTILKKNMSSEKEKQYILKLEESLKAGSEILENGGNSIDAVTAAIIVMENSPLFNAGKGAVFTEEGIVEMDASIMDGHSGLAGAVAGVHNIKNPILAAKAVMENTNHVMICGEGADDFAMQQGLDVVDTSYFFTPTRWKSYLKAKEKKNSEKYGTVGAVALDSHGNLAAGTSTGGMTYKMKGRVGDSPVIGAGTYADNSTCAVSATGHGEFFIRNVVAYDISALMKYNNMSLHESANYVILDKLKNIEGSGGIIAVDGLGNYVMPFNTPGMYRGVVTSNQKPEVFIYGNQ